jgi:hypothetical protein
MRPFSVIALLLALLLVPGPARGQTPEESPEPPPDTLSPPPLTPAEEAPPEAPTEEPAPSSDGPLQAPPGGSSTGRIFLELLGGGTLVILAGYATLSITSDSCNGDFGGCLVASFLLTMASATAAAPLGVYLTGTLLDGQGSIGSTFLGSLIGAGVGLGSGLVLALSGVGGTLLVFGVPVFALTGSVIGYELSATDVRSGATASGMRVVPTLGTTRHGGLVGGLVGSF